MFYACTVVLTDSASWPSAPSAIQSFIVFIRLRQAQHLCWCKVAHTNDYRRSIFALSLKFCCVDAIVVLFIKSPTESGSSKEVHGSLLQVERPMSRQRLEAVYNIAPTELTLSNSIQLHRLLQRLCTLQYPLVLSLTSPCMSLVFVTSVNVLAYAPRYSIINHARAVQHSKWTILSGISQKTIE